MILLIDNYDSFVYNLARYIAELGCDVEVVRHDACDVATILARQPQAVVLSPGPCTPDESGICLDLVRELSSQIPMLGVCLGHQIIAQALGGQVVRATEPRHGRTSLIAHDGSWLYDGLPNPFPATRYHSLIVKESSLPVELVATARSEDGVVMGLTHRDWPLVGVQFHPESILTTGGRTLLHNFLRQFGIPCSEIDWDERPVPEQHEDFYTQNVLRAHPYPHPR